jgi:hypothetical protein
MATMLRNEITVGPPPPKRSAEDILFAYLDRGGAQNLQRFG